MRGRLYFERGTAIRFGAERNIEQVNRLKRATAVQMRLGALGQSPCPARKVSDVGMDAGTRHATSRTQPRCTRVYTPHLKDVLGGYERDVQKMVLQDNAVRFYNLPF